MALNFKILKNQPSYNSYGQYYYNEDYNDEFYEGSGIGTLIKSDDLYTIVTQEDCIGTCNELDWKPISNIFIGNQNNIDNPNNVFVQRYYDFGTQDYLKSSAPNLVNLYFDMALNDYSFDITYDNYFSDRTGNIGVKILNWDWREGDYDFSNDFITTDTEQMDLYQEDNTTPNVLSHQYDSPGLKIIKAAVFSEDSGGNIRYKYLEIRFFLGLDGIFVEDFMDVGGPDFTYLPWPMTTPIIGGISKESDYFKSVESIVNSNPFEEYEKFERYFAHKAYVNNELGKSLGDTDIEQVRVFKHGNHDLHKLLEIPFSINTDSGFHPYYDFEYWNGGYDCTDCGSFPEESSVGSLFIDDKEYSISNDIVDDCLFEFNCGNINISYILDTSGNGNKGILMGDYKVTKEKGIKSMRDTMIKIPKSDKKNGAI